MNANTEIEPNVNADMNRREKIGLVAFIVSIAAIITAVFLYMSLSHSLDVTAAGIDDSVGDLEGYSTIVFNGNNIPRTKEKNTVEKILTQALETAEIKTEDEKDKENLEKATCSNVEEIYSDKGSKCAILQTDNYDAYSKGEIIKRGKWKIGVLSINDTILQTAVSNQEAMKKQGISGNYVYVDDIQNKINNLRKTNNADVVIVITTDQKVLNIVKYVDCVICKNVDKDVPDEGKIVKDTFVMRLPDTDTVGSCLISPAKMFSGAIYNEVETKQTN